MKTFTGQESREVIQQAEPIVGYQADGDNGQGGSQQKPTRKGDQLLLGRQPFFVCWRGVRGFFASLFTLEGMVCGAKGNSPLLLYNLLFVYFVQIFL